MSTPRGLGAAAESSPRVTVSTPSGLVSCVPYLVGFSPSDSLVLVFMTSPPRVVAVTLRVDLITADGGESLSEARAQLGAALDRTLGFGVDLDGVHMLVYSPDAHRLPATGMVDAMTSICRERGMQVQQVLAVDGDRMWRYDCSGVGCCPGEGHRVQDSEAVRAQFELVTAGVGYARDRSALEQAVLPDREHGLESAEIDAAQQECRAAAASHVGAARWRRGCEDSLIVAMRGPFDPVVARRCGAMWAVGLADSRVREPLLYRLVVAGPPALRKERLGSAREWLTGLVRIVPQDACGPVSATLAALAWQQGDGAFARIAAERALTCDPGNRLGTLIHAASVSGLPPRQWIDVLTSFTLADLRSASERGGADRRPPPRCS